jgi:hypothetical protein
MNEIKEKLTREKLYKNEAEIEDLIKDKYSKTTCHRMKEKDTFKTIFPTSDLWKAQVIFKTTNQVLKPESYCDPYRDQTFNYKTDFNKRFFEEMLKSKNMMSNKRRDDTSPSKAESK